MVSEARLEARMWVGQGVLREACRQREFPVVISVGTTRVTAVWLATSLMLCDLGVAAGAATFGDFQRRLVAVERQSLAGAANALGVNAAGSHVFMGAAEPLENRLSAGTTGLLRTMRKRVRQVLLNLQYGAGRWSAWLGGLIVFAVIGLTVPLLGQDSLKTFREEGLFAFMRELSLAVAVYVRLIIDGRTPLVGKALLAFSVAYGASGSDLFPDRFAPQSYIDDLILLILASRSFMMLCSQEIIEEHALAAAQARARNLQKKLGRRRRAVKDAARRSPAAESH